ncbi:MAG: DUF3343 domain-containing protein [Evtepia sp.]
MVIYLIMCRSLTYAQRTAYALERAGITARILRTPVDISPTGCSYSVKISGHNLTRALMILNRHGLPRLGIYVGNAEDEYREVVF